MRWSGSLKIHFARINIDRNPVTGSHLTGEQAPEGRPSLYHRFRGGIVRNQKAESRRDDRKRRGRNRNVRNRKRLATPQSRSSKNPAPKGQTKEVRHVSVGKNKVYTAVP